MFTKKIKKNTWCEVVKDNLTQYYTAVKVNSPNETLLSLFKKTRVMK